jgi:iron complex transport system substrate-binding protein
VLMDELIRVAGGRNVWQGESWTVLPLEQMIETPPALIALGFFETGRVAVNAWSPSRHPVVQRAVANARTLNMDPAAISCEAWYAIDAAEAIARELRR